MNPSLSTDRQYIDFNSVFQYKAGTYATGAWVLGTSGADTPCSLFPEACII
jgi:hypothetical protein